MEGFIVERRDLLKNTSKNHEVRHAREKNIYNMARQVIINNLEVIEPTARPVINLHLYNFIARNENVDELDLQKEFNKINRLSKLEKEYSSEGNILPTIGIEIEVPIENLTQDKVKILNKLNIPNHEERKDSLWEMNPDFSYSPWAQAQMIQELADMDALPLKESPKNSKKKIVNDEILSLHVNFGMPNSVQKRIMENNYTSITYMNDALTYAFSSPERIAGRKTKTAIGLEDDAKESKKNTNKDESSIGKRKLMRLELRAQEFRDYPTYRMLVESQRIAALLIAEMTLSGKIGISREERDLVILWQKFENDIKDLFDKFDLEKGMVDSYRGTYKIIEILKEPESDIKPNLKKSCREIISRYSKEVAKILKLKEVSGDIM